MNPSSTFVPQEIEPTDKPNPARETNPNEEVALETAIQFRPSLEAMREGIRGALMQVKFSENQTLPQLNLGAQFGLTSTAGTTPCIRNIASILSGNCAAVPRVPGSGTKLQFGGVYGDALNRLFGTSFYNYAAVLNFEYPIDNAAARSVLAQTRVQYESLRMQYRASISTAVVAVQTALANLEADQKRVQATREATYYAAQSLHDEEIRFKVGMATTHDLLQFQEQLISAQGNQVQAEVDLEDARLSLEHEQGTLLRALPNQLRAPGPASFALVLEVLTPTRRPEKETDDGKEVYQSRHDSYAARLHSCRRAAGRPDAFRFGPGGDRQGRPDRGQG